MVELKKICPMWSDSPMLWYIVTQFSSLFAKFGSFASHAVYTTGEPSNQLKIGQKQAAL